MQETFSFSVREKECFGTIGGLRRVGEGAEGR
jgi:hypothetical protein